MISKTPTGNGQALDVGVTDIADALYVRACHGQAPPCGQVTRHPPHTTHHHTPHPSCLPMPINTMPTTGADLGPLCRSRAVGARRGHGRPALLRTLRRARHLPCSPTGNKHFYIACRHIYPLAYTSPPSSTASLQ